MPRVERQASLKSRVASKSQAEILTGLKSALSQGASVVECFEHFKLLNSQIQLRCYELLFRSRIINVGIDKALRNPAALVPILREFNQIGRVDERSALQAFNRLDADQQLLAYEKLCRTDIINEGIDEFLRDPPALLQNIRANGQVLPLIDHLLIAAGGTIASRARSIPVPGSQPQPQPQPGPAPKPALRPVQRPVQVETRTPATFTRAASLRGIRPAQANPPPERYVHTDVAPHAPVPWENGVAVRSREQIKDSLDALMRSWHVRREEIEERRLKGQPVTEPTLEERTVQLRDLDKQIFLYMKRNHNVQTPMDFLWPLQNYQLDEPIPVSVDPNTFTPEEGKFYEIQRYGCPLVETRTPCQPVERFQYFGHAVKRTGNQLHLYLDGTSNGSIRINGKEYLDQAGQGRGSSRPSYLFREGDIVCSGTKYLFTVGPNGTIHYPKTERQGYDLPTYQCTQFLRGICSKDNRMAFTTIKDNVTEVVQPFEPGFTLYSGVEYQIESRGGVIQSELVDPKPKETGDRVIIDIENDPVLQSLIAYLRREFEVMGYTETQKMMRIAHLAADLLQSEPNERMQYNYRLGEVLRAGCGVCRHRATLTKVLSNETLPEATCVLIASKIPMRVPFWQGSNFLGFLKMGGAMFGCGHAWNVMQVGGRTYVVDPMQSCLFDANDPPGTEVGQYGDNIGRKSMLEDYGAHLLGKNPFRLCIIEDDPQMREYAIQMAQRILAQGGYDRLLQLEIVAPTTYAEFEQTLQRIDHGDFHYVLVDNDLSQYPDYNRSKKSGFMCINDLLDEANRLQRYSLSRDTTFYPNSSNNQAWRSGPRGRIFDNWNAVTDKKNGPMVVTDLAYRFERHARDRYRNFEPTPLPRNNNEGLPERPNSPIPQPPEPSSSTRPDPDLGSVSLSMPRATGSMFDDEEDEPSF